MAKTKTEPKPFPFSADGAHMNQERSEWAEVAILAFMGETSVDREDALCDLLADLAHWSDRNGMDFAYELRRAKNHYEAEILRGAKVTGTQFAEVVCGS